jgi:hypothetical protein
MTPRKNRLGVRHALLFAALAAGCNGVAAESPLPLPDDLLEYLGSWESDDADWLFANAAVAVPAAATSQRTMASAGAKAPAATTTTAAPSIAATTSPAPGAERRP